VVMVENARTKLAAITKNLSVRTAEAEDIFGSHNTLESVVKITKQIVVTSLLSLSVTIELLTLQERMIYDSN